MEVFKFFAQDKVHLRLSHRPAGISEDADEPGDGFFRTFPRGKKSAEGCRAGQCGPAPARQLQDKEKKEKEKKRLAAHDEAKAVMERARLFLEGKRRKRRKRKRRTPRTSSHSSRSRARLQQRQWHCPGWFCWFRAVFPFVVLRPKMRGILCGMDQKDSSTVRFWLPRRRHAGFGFFGR